MTKIDTNTLVWGEINVILLKKKKKVLRNCYHLNARVILFTSYLLCMVDGFFKTVGIHTGTTCVLFLAVLFHYAMYIYI